jgi:hypothetical protein
VAADEPAAPVTRIGPASIAASARGLGDTEDPLARELCVRRVFAVACRYRGTPLIAPLNGEKSRSGERERQEEAMVGGDRGAHAEVEPLKLNAMPQHWAL